MNKTATTAKYKASIDYHPSQIARLKDPEYAAVYLETHLEDHEPMDLETDLLNLALSNVAEAIAPDQTYAIALETILQKQGAAAIYDLADWLKGLGLKLTVTVDKKVQTNFPENFPEIEIPNIHQILSCTNQEFTGASESDASELS
jgi:DNA-binding phage protein